MLVRFNKRTIVGGSVYEENSEHDLAIDLADQVVRDGNGLVVGLGAVYSPFGAYTVGPGATYSTIAAAVAAAGDRFRSRTMSPVTATFTNGSAIVTTGGSFDIDVDAAFGSATGVFLGDFVAPGGTRYKIKSRQSATQITLHEAFAGTTGDFSITYEYLDRATVYILPGEYPEQLGPTPGLDFVGFDRDSVRVSRDAIFTVLGGATVGENTFSHLTLGPTSSFGSVDTFGGTPVAWAGAQLVFNSVRFGFGNRDGAHAGGHANFPLMKGGETWWNDIELEMTDNPFSLQSGTAAKRAKLYINGLTVTLRSSWANTSTYITGLFGSDGSFWGCDYVDGEIDGLKVNLNAAVALAWGIPAGDALAIICDGANSTWKFKNVNQSCGNTNAAADASLFTVGLRVSAGTVTVKDSMFSATGTNSGGVSGDGVVVTGGTLNLMNTNVYGNRYGARVSGGTLNIKQGCRIEGGTNSILRTAGTVNNSASQPAILIGASSGIVNSLDT